LYKYKNKKNKIKNKKKKRRKEEEEEEEAVSWSSASLVFAFHQDLAKIRVVLSLFLKTQLKVCNKFSDSQLNIVSDNTNWRKKEEEEEKKEDQAT